MPQTGFCTDVTCNKQLTELYECHCCNWLICLKHLLEHVEIVKRDKKEKLNVLHNELVSVLYTLEVLVERKLNEIEYEKKLINEAKKMTNISEYSIEEIQKILDKINQTILLNRKEEPVVKVEPLLSDMITCSYNNDLTNENITERLIISNLNSPSQNILQQPISPVYRGFRFQRNISEELTASKDNDVSIEVVNSSNTNITDNQLLNSFKDEADDERQNQENIIAPRSFIEHCPLVFDGAFGLTRAKHSIQFCTMDKSGKRNLLCHFKQKHKLKNIYAQRLFRAVRYGQDPSSTKLFSDNEDVIDHERNLQCPFSSSMINLIGNCPTQTRKIPCPHKSVEGAHLVGHLTQYHHLPRTLAKKIGKNYIAKYSKMN